MLFIIISLSTTLSEFISVLPKLKNENSCVDRISNCKMWVNKSMCETNIRSMYYDCRKTCDLCDACHPSNPSVIPGTISKTMEIAVTKYDARYVSLDPPVVRFSNFLNSSEVEQLVKSCTNFSRSLAGNEGGGISIARTSSTCWCFEECQSHSIIKILEDRISRILRIPIIYSEHIQMLKYEKKNYYKEHHDQNAAKDSTWGPRVFTFFVYLSEVDGGETYFKYLNLRETPKKGFALLWPSVLDNNPFITDIRTIHEAMPVIKGVKIALNSWYHMFDFRTPHSISC